MSRKLLLASVSAVALAAASIPAHADNIVDNQWYTGHFSGTAGQTGPLLKGFVYGLGTNGPILPNGRANAVSAPGTGGGRLSATITLSHGGYLTVTDVERSGDHFELFVNGNPATSAPTGISHLNPPGQQSVGDKTSVPVAFVDFCGNDISCSLGDANFSSGTFFLPAGTDTITGTWLGGVGTGDMALIVEAPEPASLTLLGFGLAGLGLLRRRRRKPA